MDEKKDLDLEKGKEEEQSMKIGDGLNLNIKAKLDPNQKNVAAAKDIDQNPEENNDPDYSQDDQPNDDKNPQTNQPQRNKGVELNLGINKPNQNRKIEIEVEPEENEKEENLSAIPKNTSYKKKNPKYNKPNLNEKEIDDEEDPEIHKPTDDKISLDIKDKIPSNPTDPNIDVDDDDIFSDALEKINNGNKYQALELLGNQALDVLKTEKALKAIEALKNRGLLDDDDIEKIHHSKSSKQNIPKTGYTALPNEQSQEISGDSEPENNQPIPKTLTNQEHRLRDTLPDDKKYTADEATNSYDGSEDSSPMQELDKIKPMYRGQSSKKTHHEQTKNNKNQQLAELTDQTKKVAKKNIKKVVINFLKEIFFTPPWCYYVWGSIFVGLIIIIASSYLIICIKAEDLGTCQDIVPYIASGMRTSLENIINGAVEWIEKAINNIDPTYKENVDVASKLKDAVKSTGLSQEL